MSRVTGGLGRACCVCGRPAAYTHHYPDRSDWHLCAECSQPGDAPGEMAGQLDIFGETA